MEHPEGQNEVGGAGDPQSVRQALPELDSAVETFAFGPPSRPLEHLVLDIHGNDPAVWADEPGQCYGEEAETAADVDHRVSRAYQVAEDADGIVDEPTQGIVERVSEPPWTRVRSEKQDPVQQPRTFRSAHGNCSAKIPLFRSENGGGIVRHDSAGLGCDRDNGGHQDEGIRQHKRPNPDADRVRVHRVQKRAHPQVT